MRYERGLSEDARRCEALLRDLCGNESKREIFVLVSAVREQVPAELVGSSDGLPKEVLLGRLSKRMQDNLGIGGGLARWGVESWALALGIMQAEETVFPFECPACGATGRMRSKLAGQMGKCPWCQAAIQVSDDCKSVRLIDGSPQRRSDPLQSVCPASQDSEKERFADELSATNQDLFRQALRRVLADGVITAEEQAEVQELRKRMGVSSEIASRILAEVRSEIPSKRLPTSARQTPSATRKLRSSSTRTAPLASHSPPRPATVPRARPISVSLFALGIVGVLLVASVCLWLLSAKNNRTAPSEATIALAKNNRTAPV